MAGESPRLKLNRYERGDPNWTHKDLVNLVDEWAIERGTKSSRPESGVHNNELFLATDESKLYRWDESAGEWNSVGGGGQPGTVAYYHGGLG